jgi:hypothetical protein
MKKTYTLYVMAMLGMILALGLMATGCSNSSGGGGGNIVLPGTDGLLTVTGLAAYNGKYIAVQRSDDASPHLTGMVSINLTTGVTELFPISDSQAAVKIYEFGEEVGNIKGYSGSDTATLDVLIYTSKIINPREGSIPSVYGTAHAAFSNGKATAAFTFISNP